MKTILPFAFIIISISSFSQLSANEYLTKSRHQKTAAWVMLGGGVGLTALGFAVAHSVMLSNTSDDFTGASVLAVSGVTSMLGSIPLFIIAAHNRHKAATLSFNLQKAPLLCTRSYRMAIRQPAIKLTVPL